MEQNTPIEQFAVEQKSIPPSVQIYENQEDNNQPRKTNKILVLIIAGVLILTVSLVGLLIFKTKSKESSGMQTSTKPASAPRQPSENKGDFTEEQGQPLGEQKTLVILFNYQNHNDEPYSVNEVNDLVFGENNSLNQYFREVSYGKTWLTGKVVGWYTVPYDTGPEAGGCLEQSGDALNLARKNGVDVDSYPRRIFINPIVEGCANSSGTTGENPSESLIYGKLALSSLTHEFGHNLTIGHNNLYNCGDKPIAPKEQCHVVLYADSMSPMGHFNPISGHINAFQKFYLGWIPKENMMEVTKTGEYIIAPLETQSNEPQLIKIHKPDTNEDYFLEYRQLVGLDSSLSEGITSGALIRIISYFPYVINGHEYKTPETNLIKMHMGEDSNDISKSAMEDGDTFFDPVNKIRITQISHDSKAVTLSIKFE